MVVQRSLRRNLGQFFGQPDKVDLGVFLQPHVNQPRHRQVFDVDAVAEPGLNQLLELFVLQGRNLFNFAAPFQKTHRARLMVERFFLGFFLVDVVDRHNLHGQRTENALVPVQQHGVDGQHAGQRHGKQKDRDGNHHFQKQGGTVVFERQLLLAGYDVGPGAHI